MLKRLEKISDSDLYILHNLYVHFSSVIHKVLVNFTFRKNFGLYVKDLRCLRKYFKRIKLH